MNMFIKLRPSPRCMDAELSDQVVACLQGLPGGIPVSGLADRPMTHQRVEGVLRYVCETMAPGYPPPTVRVLDQDLFDCLHNCASESTQHGTGDCFLSAYSIDTDTIDIREET